MQRIEDCIRSKKYLILVLAALIVVIGMGYGLGNDDPDARQSKAHEHRLTDLVQPVDDEHAASLQSELKKMDVIYVCPMNCVEPMGKSGRCPVCGMDLVEVNAQAHGREEGPTRITLSEDVHKAAGIQIASVEEKFVSTDIRLYGKIEYDPVEQYKVTAYAPGVIDNIYVKRAGQAVRKGDPLFDLHSAELYYLEEELFDILKKLPWKIDLRPGQYHSRKRVGRWTRLLMPPKQAGEKGELSQEETEAFQQSMKQINRKMRLLGLSEKDVEGLIVKGRPTGIATVTTPMTGVVLEQNAFRGTFVNTGDVVFTIANPRVLWARLDAYASDFPWIRLGQEAEFETDAYPGKTFTGKVVYLDPEFDPERRVFKVGVLYRDEKGLLKPNMLVRCDIHAKLTSGGRGTAEIVTQGMMGTAQARRTDQAPLVIPETAPLITGKRAVVYVQVPDQPGTYVGREVDLGPRAAGYYIVHQGLHKGEMVVVNGNFKIDSAVQILAKSSMMSHESSALPVDHYDHVHTPPVPAELQGEPSDKGAKYEIYSGKRGTSNETANEKTYGHAMSQHQAKKAMSEGLKTAPENTTPPLPIKIPGEARCPVCGMYPARFAKWQTQVIFKDGEFRGFDGPKDMFKYLLEMEKYESKYTPDDVAVIYAKDFLNRKWIDAKKTHYVIGSKISGPMGNDLIPFSDPMKAMKFAETGGGSSAQYSEINLKMIQSSVAMQQGDMHQHE